MERGGGAMAAPVEAVKVKPVEATAENFSEFGQVIGASPDGEKFGPHDAQLDLSRGIPRFTGSKFVKLHRGTWHAGPLFEMDMMDFYNLELSNTNAMDRITHNFIKKDGVYFVVDE